MTFYLNGFDFSTTALARDYVAAVISSVLDVLAVIYITLAQKIVSASTATLLSTLEIPFRYVSQSNNH